MPTQLILGEDVTKMSDEYIATVGNEELIAINQDVPLVRSARRIVGGDLKFPCGEPKAIDWSRTTAPVEIPSLQWAFDGDAGTTGSKLPGQTDIRSGGPGCGNVNIIWGLFLACFATPPHPAHAGCGADWCLGI